MKQAAWHVLSVAAFVGAALCGYFATDIATEEWRSPILGWRRTFPYLVVELLLAALLVVLGVAWWAAP